MRYWKSWSPRNKRGSNASPHSNEPIPCSPYLRPPNPLKDTAASFNATRSKVGNCCIRRSRLFSLATMPAARRLQRNLAFLRNRLWNATSLDESHLIIFSVARKVCAAGSDRLRYRREHGFLFFAGRVTAFEADPEIV